jgi:hypothetical protein
MIFGVQSLDVQIWCSVLFDVQYLSAFGHSAFGHLMLGPYSALGPIWCSVIRCSVIRCSVIRCSIIRCSVIRCSVIRCSVFRCSVFRRSVIRCTVFRRSVGESKNHIPLTPSLVISCQTSKFLLKYNFWYSYKTSQDRTFQPRNVPI